VSGLAACAPDDDACLEQSGDNSAEVDVDSEGEGGDAIAGSQVITVTGAGNTNITANNDSRFATARGGDVNGNTNININNGPTVSVRGPSQSAAANAAGVASTTQSALPKVQITLEQAAFPTGAAPASSAALAMSFATGASVFSQTPLSPFAVTQTINRSAISSTLSEVEPTVSVVGDNVAFVTGSALVSQAATAVATPVASAIGGSASADATGVATANQTADPDVTLSLSQIAFPSGASSVTTASSSVTTLRGVNIAAGGGPVVQEVNQAGASSVTTTVRPSVDVAATNNASVTGSAPVSQLATVFTAPVVSATAIPRDVSAQLLHLGDNALELDVDNELVAGDAIAGSNVIAVAGTGDTTIVANNRSLFATAEGGDVEANNIIDAHSGPTLAVTGGRSEVLAVATGTAGLAQTATPAIDLLVTQVAAPTGAIAAINSARTVTTLDASNVSGPLGGPIVQLIVQNGSSRLVTETAPSTSVLGSNAAIVMADAGVSQSGLSAAAPVAIGKEVP
jgi:hypothetical protein